MLKIDQDSGWLSFLMMDSYLQHRGLSLMTAGLTVHLRQSCLINVFDPEARLSYLFASRNLGREGGKSYSPLE